MKRHDLKGRKIGLLTILEYSKNSNAGHSIWKCKCECGNIVERTATSIIRSKYSSCDECRGSMIKNSNSKHWQGVGEISKDWFYSKILRSANGSKGNRKIKEVSISLEYIWELFLIQNRKCIYTGIELTFPKDGHRNSYKESTASLDRINSDVGYIEGNVQFVHKHINLMKNVFSDEYFLSMCRLVANNN